MVKIVSPKSRRSTKIAPVPQGFSLISNEKLLEIYTAMLKCRLLERRASTLFQDGKLNSNLSVSAGREAMAAAVGIDMQAADTLNLPQDDWLPAFVKGMSAERIFRNLAIQSTRSNKLHKNLEFVAEQNILLGSDDALRAESARTSATEAKAAKRSAIVVVFLPRELQAIKAWKAVLAAASAEKLPLVFVHPLSLKNSARQKTNPDALIHGVPGIAVDGTDPVAVYRVAFEAIIRARQGRGATLLQCADHATSRSHKDIQALGQSHDALSNFDPVIAIEIYLRRKQIDPEKHSDEVVSQFSHDLDLATRFLTNEVKSIERIGSIT